MGRPLKYTKAVQKFSISISIENYNFIDRRFVNKSEFINSLLDLYRKQKEFKEKENKTRISL